MSAALESAEDHVTLRPSLRASMRPTLAPTSTSRPTTHASEAPSTQRCATVHPRFAAAARQEAQSLLASMRSNADFLSGMLYGNAPPSALDALEDLRRCIDWLEQGVAVGPGVFP